MIVDPPSFLLSAVQKRDIMPVWKYCIRGLGRSGPQRPKMMQRAVAVADRRGAADSFGDVELGCSGGFHRAVALEQPAEKCARERAAGTVGGAAFDMLTR